MVTRLPLPDTCSVTLMDSVVAERANGPNAGYFNGISAEWRSRIETYIAEHGNPESVPKWPAIHEHRTRFHTLYNTPQEHHSQYPVLKGLRDRKFQFCPSCGEEGSPSTIDHYLPKEDYPHFSVTPANLTPMCDACQTAKGQETVDKGGRRIFLHPYFDEFLTAQVVRLTLGAASHLRPADGRALRSFLPRRVHAFAAPFSGGSRFGTRHRRRHPNIPALVQ